MHAPRLASRVDASAITNVRPPNRHSQSRDRHIARPHHRRHDLCALSLSPSTIQPAATAPAIVTVSDIAIRGIIIIFFFPPLPFAHLLLGALLGGGLGHGDGAGGAHGLGGAHGGSDHGGSNEGGHSEHGFKQGFSTKSWKCVRGNEVCTADFPGGTGGVARFCSGDKTRIITLAVNWNTYTGVQWSTLEYTSACRRTTVFDLRRCVQCGDKMVSESQLYFLVLGLSISERSATVQYSTA